MRRGPGLLEHRHCPAAHGRRAHHGQRRRPDPLAFDTPPRRLPRSGSLIPDAALGQGPNFGTHLTRTPTDRSEESAFPQVSGCEDSRDEDSIPASSDTNRGYPAGDYLRLRIGLSEGYQAALFDERGHISPRDLDPRLSTSHLDHASSSEVVASVLGELEQAPVDVVIVLPQVRPQPADLPGCAAESRHDVLQR